jgi:hypothetical protein
MASPVPGVSVFDLHKNQEVVGKIVELNRQWAYFVIQRKWRQNLTLREDLPIRAVTEESDYYWNWPRLVRRFYSKAECECLGLLIGPRIEGAIIYRVNEQSAIEPGKGAVFVEFLAPAPRNRPSLCVHPRYKYVGTGLLTVAVLHSYQLGLGGRVSLCPVGNSAGFYEERDFLRTKVHKDGMVVYEIPTQVAIERLAKKGVI